MPATTPTRRHAQPSNAACAVRDDLHDPTQGRGGLAYQGPSSWRTDANLRIKERVGVTIVGRTGLIAVAVAAVLTAAGCSTPVDPSEFDQASPAIAGNVVVWEDSRNVDTTRTDIYLFDTYSATETPV